MNIEYVAPLQRGWERMRRTLFEPFDLGKWLVLAFSLWLARLANGGGGGGGKFNLGEGPDLGAVEDAISDAWSTLLEHAIWIPLIVLGVLVLVAVIVLLVWISSRGRFIFLDNVVHNRAAIVEPWKRFRHLGDSLFLWRVCFGLVCVGVVVLVLLAFLAPAIASASLDALKGLSIAAIALGVLLAIAFGLAVALVSLFLDSFVVPVMYRYNQSATAAWRAFLPWLKQYPAQFILYALFVFVLLLVLGVASVLVCAFTCCLAFCVPFLGSYILAVVLLPLWVAYRAFTIEFLAQLDPGFDLFAAAEREAVTAAGAEGGGQ